MTTADEQTRTDRLIKWAVALKYSEIPDHVIQRTKDFFLDTLGCAIAGRDHPAVSAMVRFAAQMGPSSGKSELIDSSQNLTTSPAFASLINAAASHVVEQDDLHNRSIMHPVSWSCTHLCTFIHEPAAYPLVGNCHFPCCFGSGSGSGC